MGPGMYMLAPLQGITDPVFRHLLTQLGGIDACISVYARVSQEALPLHALQRICPEMGWGGRTRAGVPVFLQLLGGQGEALAESAKTAAEAGVLGIDLNFGCPQQRVNRHDGGAALLQSPNRITQILRAVRDVLPPPIGLSAKLRIGWSSSREVLDIAQAVEQGGANWMTLHGRTRIQQYEGQADWEAIGKASRSVSIPVVANGDIRTIHDYHRCREQSGCEHVMIGRGALSRPELFRQLAGIDPEPWTVEDRFIWLLRIGEIAAAKFPLSGIPGRIKALWRYMGEADPEISLAFNQFKHLTSWYDLKHTLQTITKNKVPRQVLAELSE